MNIYRKLNWIALISAIAFSLIKPNALLADEPSQTLPPLEGAPHGSGWSPEDQARRSQLEFYEVTPDGRALKILDTGAIDAKPPRGGAIFQVNKQTGKVEVTVYADGLTAAAKRKLDAIAKKQLTGIFPKVKVVPPDLIRILDEVIREADPEKRLLLVRKELAAARNSSGKATEAQIKALEELEKLLITPKGNGFLMKILKSTTGKMLIVDALVNAPFALYSMYQAYERGEMNDLSDAAFVLIDFVPAGISVKRALTEGMTTGTVLSFAKEALYFTPAWPIVLTGDVLVMSVEIGTAINVSNYQAGLVDLLVYNGVFEKGKLSHLELSRGRVELGELKPFLFETKYVAVKTSTPEWGPLGIADLSEKAMDVYSEHYLKADSVLEQLRTAAETQLSEINKAEAGKYLDIYNGNFIPGIAAAKYLVWMAGFDLVCNKSPEKWCKVFNLLKDKIEKRKEWIQINSMIPDLIRLAEAKHATLNAAEDLAAKMKDLQKELEELRGSGLGINLVDDINKRADELANAKDSKVFGATDTKETKTMTKGAYWQTAFAAYKKIYDLTNDLKSKVLEETGFERPGLLQFEWSGNFDQDLLRATQSRTGYFLDVAKIKGDINQIKGGTPDLSDTVDKQAFEILGDVAFPWRADFDQANKSGPTGESNINDIQATGSAFDPKHREGSKFFSEYKEALEKVKALYGKKDDFQAQLEKGAQIVRDQDFLLLGDGRGSRLELKFTDEELKKNLEDTALSIQWTANPSGTFRPDDKNLEIKFTPGGPRPVTISVQVEKRGKKETVTGILKVVLPVKVPDNFLQLTLSPAAPKPGTKVNADTTIDRRFDSMKYKYHYKWSGFQVEQVDRPSTTVTAPKSGEAAVSVELLIEDADEKWVSLTTKQVSFSVSGKPGDKDIKDSGIRQDGKDTSPTATVPTTTTPTPPVAPPTTPTPTTPDPTPSTPTTTTPTPPVATPTTPTPTPPDPTPTTPTTATPTTTTPTPPVTSPATPAPTPPGTPAPGTPPPVTPTKDAKSQAKEKYEWMKNIIPYLEKLIELDERAFTNFEKAVRKDVLGGVASGKYGAPPVPKECSGKGRGEMAARIAEIEKVLPNYYKCGMIIEDALTKQKIWGCIDDPQYPKLSSERNVLEVCLKGRDAVTYWELKCIDTPARERREHKVMLKAKLAAAKDSKAYNLFQEYANFDDYTGYLKEIERTKKELDLPDPIPSPVTLPWSYSSSCGGAAVSPTDTTKLTVALKKAPDKASYKPGNIVSISAVVTGGKKPYAYTWSGNHAGKGQQVSFTSSKPGDYKLSVGVKDAAGAGGGASITLTVEGITASIEGLGKQVIYGTSLPISVSIRDMGLTDAKKPEDSAAKKTQAKEWKTDSECSGKKGAVMPSPDDECEYRYDENCNQVLVCPDDEATTEKRGSYRVVWFSDKEGLIFNPSTSYDSKTNVLFNRMGPIKIWADIQKQSGEGVYSTIGETEQKEVTVIPPTFKWTFDPPKGLGKVGQEVKAIITSEPAINAGLINYEWSYPESSNRMEYENNASIIGFVPKEPKPMMLLVAPKVPHYREPIGGGLEEDYQAGEYSVSISEPRYRGVKPRIWKPQEWKSPEWKQGYGFEGEGGLTAGGGLVEVADNQFAVFHDIIMKVEVSPSPEKTPRYQWSVAPQGCTISNPITQEISLNCSNTGTYHVKVGVRDAEGVSLGEASRDVSISISQEELNTGTAKAKPTVTVKADKTTLTVGESVSATATVDGGKSPYTYKWSGEYQGQGQSVRF
ncbi:MAG: hypothetical protein HYX79_05015, partial [Chloroflexi bacterium]|nr:hypothetical protein [Chloroflexota bacterium]